MSRIVAEPREPVGPTDRGHIGSLARTLLYALQGGRCAACKQDRVPSDMDLDHRICLELGGADEASNWQLLCREPCHRIKTAKDRKAMAKAARLRRQADPETRRRPTRRLRGRGFDKDPLRPAASEEFR